MNECREDPDLGPHAGCGRTQAAAVSLHDRHPAVKGEGEVLGAVMGLPRRRQAKAERARLDKVPKAFASDYSPSGKASGSKLPVRWALITGRSPTVGESNHYWASWRAAIKGRLNASGRASRQSALSRGVTSLTVVGHVLAALCRWTRFRSARQLLVPSPQAP